MIKATIIFGTDAVRHYDETEEIPDAEALQDTGCLVTQKTFSSQEQYKSYVEALDDYDGFNDYRIVDRVETKDTDLDSSIKSLLRESPFVSFYFVTAIDVLLQYVSQKADEELWKTFKPFLKPGRVREDVRLMYNRLNNLPDDHIPE